MVLQPLLHPYMHWQEYQFRFYFFRFFERVGKGLRAAPRDSLISGSIKKNEAGKTFGFQKAMDNSGAIVGPLIAFLLLSFFPLNYTNIFLLATIPAILGVLTIVIFIKEAKAEKKQSIRFP